MNTADNACLPFLLHAKLNASAEVNSELFCLPSNWSHGNETLWHYYTYSNIYPTRCNVTQFILSQNCSTCFGWYHHPSSGTQTTVSTASGMVFVTPLLLPAAIAVWQIPDAVDTVVCAPDDGWWYHPKHVEQFSDKINCVTLHLVGHMSI